MKKFLPGFVRLSTSSVLILSLVACGGAEERKVKYLEKSKVFLAEKNYDKARIELKNVLQIDPKYAEAYYYMGQLEEYNKEMMKAVANYRKAIELDPVHTLSKVKLSRIYVIAGTEETIKEATTLLEEIAQEDPDNIDAELTRAYIEYKTGSQEKAVAEMEAVVKKDGTLIEGVITLSSYYIRKGEIEKTKNLLIDAAKNNPQNLSVRKELAGLYSSQLKDNETAEKYLLDMISIQPETYPLKIWLSSFYARTGQVEKAEAILREGLSQDEDDANRYLMLVELLSARVGTKEAVDELNKAIKNKPELYELVFAKVKMFVKKADYTNAKNTLVTIIENHAYDAQGTRARILLAKILLEQGDQLGAKVYINEVLSEFPNNNDALLINGKLALANFQATDAINGLRTVVKNDPKNTEASFLLAQAYDLNNENALAENELKKSIEINPINDQTHVNYARYLVSKGRKDEAESVVEKALTYFKGSYDLLDLKLRIEVSSGDQSEVLSILNRMEQADSNKPDVNINKGNFYLSKQNYTSAIQEFEKAYKKSKNKYEPLKLITQVHLQNKAPEQAIERLKLLLTKDANDAIANQLLGLVYLTQRKVAQARDKFKLAINTDKFWLKPYQSLASSYLAEKDFDQAISVYEMAISNLVDKAPAQAQLAAIYERQKDYTKAMAVYSQILDVYPDNILAANNYASLLLDNGSDSDFIKALELSKRFEKIPQLALRDTLGWAYAKTGDNIKAIEILKPIVEKAPKAAVFRYHLGFALYHNGDKAAAKSHLEISASSDQLFVGKDHAKKLLNSL